MDQNKAIALVASGMVSYEMSVGDADTTGWRWEYFAHEGEWFAVRFVGDMAIAVEIFEEFAEANDHFQGWVKAENKALGLDDDDEDEPEFVYDDVEA